MKCWILNGCKQQIRWLTSTVGTVGCCWCTNVGHILLNVHFAILWLQLGFWGLTSSQFSLFVSNFTALGSMKMNPKSINTFYWFLMKKESLLIRIKAVCTQWSILIWDFLFSVNQCFFFTLITMGRPLTSKEGAT